MTTNLAPHPLQHIELFAGLKQETLDQLVALSTPRAVASGDFFILEGDPADSFYALRSGQAAVMKGWQGKQYVLDHLTAGACFGEIGMLDLSPRMASVLAVENSCALEITSQILFQLFEEDAQQFALIQMNIARTVSRRFRQASERLFDTRLRVAKLIQPR